MGVNDISKNFSNFSMKKLILLLILLFYSNSFSQWSRANAGVDGGIIFSVYAVPSTNIIYSASNGSGVFKSTNAGDNWFAVNTGIYDYGFYPTTFTSTSAGVFMGASYTTVNGGGMYRTTNAGSSWQKINTGLTGLSMSINMAVSINNDIAIATDSGVFRSTNNGNSWSNISNNMGSTVLAQSLYYSNDTLIAGTTSGLYFSTGTFTNWTSISTGLPSGAAPYSINKFNNKLYLVYFGGGLFVSSNNGLSWSSANYNLTGSQLNARCLYIYNNTLFLSGNGGIYTLGDNTWTNMNTGLPTDYPFFYWLTSAPGKLITCTYGKAIYVTTNAGASWAQKISGLAATSVQANKILNVSGVLFSASAINGVYKSTDGGDNWITVNNGNNLKCNNIYSSGNKIYSLTDGGVFSTTNSGVTWAAQNTGLAGNDLKTRCMFVDGANSYLGTYNGILRSTDDGQSWQPTSFYSTAKMIDCFAKVNGILFAGSEGVSNSLVKSSDNFATWEWVRFYQSFTPQVFDIFVEGITMYIGTGHGVHKSTNTGANWTILNDGLGGDPYVSSIIRVGTNLLCTQTAGGRGVFRTTNDGANWAEVTGEGPFWSDFRNIISYNNKVFVSTGSGIYSRPENQLVVGIQNGTARPLNFSLKQNYPNPFNPETKINYSVRGNEFVRISVYDIAGKLVSTLVNDYRTAGEYSVNFNAGNFPSGTYFYELKAGDFSETKKMVLIK